MVLLVVGFIIGSYALGYINWFGLFGGNDKQPAATTLAVVPAEPTQAPRILPTAILPSGEPLKIGLLAPLGGAVPGFGRSTVEGVQIAVDDWNARGGVLGRPIELIIEDSRCEADPAVNAANKLIDQDGVKYLVGEICSNATIPVSEIANARGVVQISPTSTNTAVTVDANGNTKQYIFRACFIDPFQGRVMAKFARGRGFQNAFILYDESNDYVRGLAEAFEASFTEMGGAIAGKGTYTSFDQDFSIILSKVNDSGADMLFLPDYYNIVNLVGAQSKQMGYPITIMGGDGWDSSDLDVGAADGGFYSNHYDPADTRPIVQRWLARYGAYYQDADGNPKVPDALATLAYDSTNLLLTAIEQAGVDDPAKVAEVMAGIKFDAVSGTITFDAQHNPVKNAVVIGVSGGNKYFVELVEP